MLFLLAGPFLLRSVNTFHFNFSNYNVLSTDNSNKYTDNDRKKCAHRPFFCSHNLFDRFFPRAIGEVAFAFVHICCVVSCRIELYRGVCNEFSLAEHLIWSVFLCLSSRVRLSLCSSVAERQVLRKPIAKQLFNEIVARVEYNSIMTNVRVIKLAGTSVFFFLSCCWYWYILIDDIYLRPMNSYDNVLRVSLIERPRARASKSDVWMHEKICKWEKRAWKERRR